MTALFHINPSTGNTGPCVAQEGNCPHGTPEDHYLTEADARQAYELKNQLAAIPTAATARPPRDLPRDREEFAREVLATVENLADSTGGGNMQGFSKLGDAATRPVVRMEFSNWPHAQAAAQALEARGAVVTYLDEDPRTGVQPIRVAAWDEDAAVDLFKQANEHGQHSNNWVTHASDLNSKVWPPAFTTHPIHGRTEIYLADYDSDPEENEVRSWTFGAFGNDSFSLEVFND